MQPRAWGGEQFGGGHREDDSRTSSPGGPCAYTMALASFCQTSSSICWAVFRLRFGAGIASGGGGGAGRAFDGVEEVDEAPEGGTGGSVCMAAAAD